MERHRADYKIYVDGKKHFTTSYQYQMNMEKNVKLNWLKITLVLVAKNFWSGKVFIYKIQNA